MKEQFNGNGVEIFEITTYYGPDPETEALYRSPMWQEFAVRFKKYQAEKAKTPKLPNKEALDRLAKIAGLIQEVIAASEFPLHSYIDLDDDEDQAFIYLKGVGAEISDDAKKAFIAAISAADMVDLQASFEGDQFVMRFFVQDLNIYIR